MGRTTSRRTTSRRNFLRGAGGIAVALPFLESIGPARAGGSATPLRYLQFSHPQGTLIDEWTPTGPSNAMVLPEILSPLESVRDSIVVVSNCNNNAASDTGWSDSGGHVGPGRTMFTCATNSGNNDLADGPSIDQVIAQRLNAPTPHRSLQFGIGGENLGEYVSVYAAAQDPVPFDGNPVSVFEQLFADFEVDPDLAPTTMQRLRARRESVLDTVLDQFNSTMSAASAQDRATLERHAEKIRQLEQQLGNAGVAGAGCSIPMLDIPAGYEPYDANQDNVSSRAFLDLMVMALACDLTRVGTLQYTQYHSPSYAWLPFSLQSYPEWHSMVHDVPNMADVSQPRMAFRWYMEELAYLLEQASATPDGDGSLLDHMLVLSISELGDGAVHSTQGLPIVLAGNLNGTLETGRHVDVGGGRTGELYTTFLNWFGQDDTTFGNPTHCNGPLTI